MDAASTDYLLTLARMASLNPSVMSHLKFLGTIVACWSREVSTLSRCLTVSRKAACMCAGTLPAQALPHWVPSMSAVPRLRGRELLGELQ